MLDLKMVCFLGLFASQECDMNSFKSGSSHSPFLFQILYIIF